MGTRLKNVEDHLLNFASIVREDVDKALPLVERAIAVAAKIYPLIGKVATPLIQAVIKAEAAAASARASGATAVNKLADVLASVGPEVQAALNALPGTGHPKIEELVTKVVDGLRAPSNIPAK